MAENNLDRLKDHFDPLDIEWRIGRSGEKNGKIWASALAYITSRAIHDRLDEVCGVAGWQMRYKEHLGGTICEIGVKVGDEWIWKAGGSDATQIEAFKGGLSGAEKRAGVPWGIGRYLYNLSETFVEISESKINGWNYAKTKDKTFYWKTPELPRWALPKNTEEKTIKKEIEKIAAPDLLTQYKIRFDEIENPDGDLFRSILNEAEPKLNTTDFKILESYSAKRFKQINR